MQKLQGFKVFLVDVLKLHSEQIFVLFKSSWSTELSIKNSKESTKTLCLLKTRNKVVEVR
jgi:hypothetical protein